jgi:hypothetical protein
VTGTVQGSPLAAPGAVAAPAIPALTLSGLALAGALTLAGPVFRAILGLLQVLVGASIALSAGLVIANPRGAAAPAVTERTGIAGERSAAGLLDAATVTALPALTMTLGIASAGVGVLLLVTLQRWPSRSRRFSAVRVEPEPGSVGEWDALSDGSDPTADRREVPSADDGPPRPAG